MEKQQQQLQASEKAQAQDVDSKSESDERVPPLSLSLDDNSNTIKMDSPGSDEASKNSPENVTKEPVTSRSDKSDLSATSDKSDKSDQSSTKSARSSHSAKSNSSKSSRDKTEKVSRGDGSTHKTKQVKFDKEPSIKIERDNLPTELKLEVRDVKHISSISRDSPVYENVKMDSPRMARITIGASRTPDLNVTPKRKLIIQPQRTPRVLETNTLIIHQEKATTGPSLMVTNHKPPKARKPEPILPAIIDNDDPAESVATFIEDDTSTHISTSPVKPTPGYLSVPRKSSSNKGSGKSRKGGSGKRTRVSAGRKGSSGRTKTSATNSGRPTTRGSSAVSIPEEPDDYYSDDFDEDDNTSGSLTDDGKNNKSQ